MKKVESQTNEDIVPTKIEIINTIGLAVIFLIFAYFITPYAYKILSIMGYITLGVGREKYALYQKIKKQKL